MFSGKVYHPEPPHAPSLFLFPIVFGNNLIHFFDGKNKIGSGQDLIICLGFSITRRAACVIWKRGNKKGEIFFGNGKCELIANFSATMVTSPSRERREVWREKRKVRIFGKGKWKLIANCANFWQGSVKGKKKKKKRSVKGETKSANFWQGKV